MTKESLSSRDRWLAVLTGEKPDRIPMDIWATPETMAKIEAHFGCDAQSLLDTWHVDSPITLSGRYVGPELEPDVDVWGVKHRPIATGSEQYDEAASHPLAEYDTVDAVEANYTWPNADWWDFSHLPTIAATNKGRAIRGGISEPFLLYKNLRGDEQAFLDLLINPEMAHHCIAKIVDLDYELSRRLFETVPGEIIISYVAEDVGGQDGLMYSPDQIRTFFLPQMRRMIRLFRENGSHIFFHSDGAIRDILPDLIDIGIEVLNPIQWRCTGMERKALKRDFGDKLAFHGGVDNQHTLPFGSAEDVRQEVIENIETFGRDGRYILAPCHNIQCITPIENIVALYETGYECGWL